MTAKSLINLYRYGYFIYQGLLQSYKTISFNNIFHGIVLTHK